MKLSEFYTSISLGRTDEEYFLSKNNFSVVSGSFLQFGKNNSSSNYFHIETYENEIPDISSHIHLYEGNVQIDAENNININGSIQYNNNEYNTSGGLVVLNENGKIPSSLIPEINKETMLETNFVQLQTNCYYTCTSKVSSIDLIITEDLDNTYCIFSTADNVAAIDVDITIPSGFIINDDFVFEPNKTYIILVDNKIIAWGEMFSALQQYSY